MKIYDLSLPLDAKLPVWPGNSAVSLQRTAKIEEGASSNLSWIMMGTHSGTHLDAPYHFNLKGKTVDLLPLEILIGPVKVLEVPSDTEMITEKVLKKFNWKDIERILFKTANSDKWSNQFTPPPVMPHPSGQRGGGAIVTSSRMPRSLGRGTGFTKNYVALALDGAEFLVKKGIKLVGIDYLSIESYGAKAHPVHHFLLDKGVVILEALYLKDVPQGDYQLIALPLKITGADGAPTRVVLIET